VPRQFSGKGDSFVKNGAGIIVHSDARKKKKTTFDPYLPSYIKSK